MCAVEQPNENSENWNHVLLNNEQKMYIDKFTISLNMQTTFLFVLLFYVA